MKIFDSSPYKLLIAFIVNVIILVAGMLESVNLNWLSLALVMMGIAMGYFVLPRYMKFKLIYTINKEGIRMEEKGWIKWQEIESIEEESSEDQHLIIVKYKKANEIKTEIMYCNELYLNKKRALSLMNKHLKKVYV